MPITRRQAMLFPVLSAGTAAGFAAPTVAPAGELVVFCAGAVRSALADIQATWAARGAARLKVEYATAGDWRRRLVAGELADVVVLPLESFSLPAIVAVTDPASRRDLGAVGIGIAVRQGTPLPDLSSEDSLKRALLAARSVTFMDPERGTSGRHVDEVVLPKLAIRDAVRAKTVLGEGGMLAERVASGEVEIAIQQMTELLPVTGVTVVGELPASLQKVTVYSAAVTRQARSPEAARAFIDFLIEGAQQQVFAAKGFRKP
jgi:molybdate transport system substrate-binding protein